MHQIIQRLEVLDFLSSIDVFRNVDPINFMYLDSDRIDLIQD